MIGAANSSMKCEEFRLDPKLQDESFGWTLQNAAKVIVRHDTQNFTILRT